MKIPFAFLFQCMACKTPLSPHDFFSPLCPRCEESLTDCPPLCPQCAGWECVSNDLMGDKDKDKDKDTDHDQSKDGDQYTWCLRPWRKSQVIDSSSARYLMMGQGYEVLKSWKKNRGLLFDRCVLKQNSSLLASWRKTQPDWIIPMPQPYARTWQMRGNRAEQIAQWMSSLLKVPVLEVLNVQKKQRQGQLNLAQRLKNPIQFSVMKTQIQRLHFQSRVILVDDFRTTGYTLEKAAESLKLGGASYVHAFTLGIRPFSSTHTQSATNLSDRRRGAIPIR